MTTKKNRITGKYSYYPDTKRIKNNNRLFFTVITVLIVLMAIPTR